VVYELDSGCDKHDRIWTAIPTAAEFLLLRFPFSFPFPASFSGFFYSTSVNGLKAFQLNRLRNARGFLQAATVNRHKCRTPMVRDSHALCVKISRQAGWAFWCTCDFIGVFAQKSVGTAGAKSFLETG
jgi:hypothetical protein